MFSSGSGGANRPWAPKTVRDFESITLRLDSYDFTERFGASAEALLDECYYSLYSRISKVARQIFAGNGNLTAKQSPWVHQYPNEFYEHVKAIARSDPNTKHWEGLLRNGEERIVLITGIIMRVLDSQVFSSLLFGANDMHKRVLGCYDIDLLDCDGFERSQLLARLNEAYLREASEAGGIPPLLSTEMLRVVSQLGGLLLPLYNVVGAESPNVMPSLEELCQGLGYIVSYAAWLAVMNRLVPGVTTLTWIAPGDDYELEQFNFMHSVFDDSKAKSKKYDKRYFGGTPPRRTARTKISVFPGIRYYPPPSSGTGGPGWYRGFKVRRPHAAYYFGLSDSREDAKTLLPLPDYIRRVRKPRGIPHGALVLLSAIIIVLCFRYMFVYLFGYANYVMLLKKSIGLVLGGAHVDFGSSDT